MERLVSKRRAIAQSVDYLISGFYLVTPYFTFRLGGLTEADDHYPYFISNRWFIGLILPDYRSFCSDYVFEEE